MIKKNAIVEDREVICNGKRYRFRIVNVNALRNNICDYCIFREGGSLIECAYLANPKNKDEAFYNFCISQNIDFSFQAIPIINIDEKED